MAALASEAPLLLIGPHGTGKSFLLLRLAEALGLRFRHYNASLLSFDDLVGFPMPDALGGIRYVPTAASIQGAEAVFLDEISRARPEVQNKLFSIIHERRALGMPLTDLRYRWSAMNPPPEDGEDAGEYSGAERLDVALADRFAFVCSVSVVGRPVAPGAGGGPPEGELRDLRGGGRSPDDGRSRKRSGGFPSCGHVLGQ